MHNEPGYPGLKFIVICVGVASLTLSACASSIYAASPLAMASTDPAVGNPVVRARSGDKHAQFDLGVRFETGDGVEKNRAQAIALYRQAASSSGGILWVWSPAVGNVPGRTIPINQGPVVPGLPEARKRLQEMGTL